MPAYDYKCSDCEIVEEKIHNIDQKPHYLCPLCNNLMFRYFGNQTVRFDGPLHEFVDISGEQPRVITSKRQIREIEQRENKVLGGHDEIRQEAKKNMKAHKAKLEAESSDTLMKDIVNLRRKCKGY